MPLFDQHSTRTSKLVGLLLAAIGAVSIAGIIILWPGSAPGTPRNAAPSVFEGTRLTASAPSSSATSTPLEFASTPSSTTVPVISWSPSSTTQTISPGQSKTVPVSFTSTQNLSNVAVQIVPALQPFVQISPQNFLNISKGQTEILTLTISASSNASLGAVDGTIQLRSGNTIARPLPVTVNIWPKAQLTSAGIALDYPPSFVPVASMTTPGQAEGFYQSTTDQTAGLPPLFTVTIQSVTYAQTLEQFAESEAGENLQHVTIGTLQYLTWFEPGEGTGAISYASFINPSQILIFTTASSGFAASSDFQAILGSVGAL